MANGNKGLMLLMKIVMLVGMIGLGELFLSGTFLNGTLLGFLPEMIHTIAGWAIIGFSIWDAFRK